MENIRNSLTAKIAAFLLTILFVVIIVFSTIGVAVNLDCSWYHMNDADVEKEIYHETASRASTRIMDSIYNSLIYADEYEDIVYIDDENELISGESLSGQFGYTVKSNSDNFKFGTKEKSVNKRSVNKDFQKIEGVYTEKFFHDDFDIIIYLGALNSGEIPDELYAYCAIQTFIYNYRYEAAVVGGICVIAVIFLLVFLLISLGRDSVDRQKSHIFIERVPADLITAVSAAIVAVIFSVTGEFAIYSNDNIDLSIFLLIACTVATTAVVLGLFSIIAIKLRKHNLCRSSLIYIVIKLIKRLLKYIMKSIYNGFPQIPLVWKTAVALAIGIVINFIIVNTYYYYSSTMFVWFIGAALVFAGGVYIALCLKRLKNAVHHIAEGELDYKVDKKGLFFELADCADDLNNIGSGMAKAVNEKMKSEHFKTELITNVSHDIKTPLTSIINYVDFLKNEDIDNEKAVEYIEVLDRQSQKMKKLIEDLVEASKAATGALKLNMEKCSIGILMTQAAGEYEERLEAGDLKLVSRISDENIETYVDGRSMWRVFDNILNNICKYSQPGTRVYQTLEENNGKAIIIYRNTSKYELNITEEELMERFVRGDKSRNTEGSGLGLSIAKNLIELQGGKFEIKIDGDLFKVMIELDLYDK